jgi:hypothetical protein
VEDIVRIFKSPEGDVYHITLSEDNGVLSAPNTSKNTMPPQEYRSRLFEKMFQRYVNLHNLSNVRLSVVEINGINEKYYFHVIYRESHLVLASMIGSDLKEGFGK